MKGLQRGRQNSKTLKRGSSDPTSVNKTLKFSKRLLEKSGRQIESDIEEGHESCPITKAIDDPE
jgi:hypothetical protein